MSTESNSGAEPETRTPPTGEAGCETEIDRNVLGTVVATGFTELRRRLVTMYAEQSDWYVLASRESDEVGRRIATRTMSGLHDMLSQIDALEADVKDETRRAARKATS
jgi:hypothetical protein